MEPIDLVALVLERGARLVSIALKAAFAGDKRKVDEILPPDPDSYPDEVEYQRLKNAADRDYGPGT